MVTYNRLMLNPARLGVLGARLVSTVDDAAPVTEGTNDGIGGLENALATIFGFAGNVDITESPFSFDSTGRLTKPLIRIGGAAGPMGLRLRDPNLAAPPRECRLVLTADTLTLEEQNDGPGSETAPTYVTRLSLVLTTGFWANLLTVIMRLDTNVITLAPGNNNNLAITAGYLLVTPNSTGSDVTGFSASQGDGQWIVIDNIAGYKLGFLHESSFSTAANRLWLPGDVGIAKDSTTYRNHVFRYRGDVSRWILVSQNY